MPICPECGNDAIKSLKEWNYYIFHVVNTACECGCTFRAYYKNEKLSHIIENGLREPQRSILKYLRQHSGVADTEEIANALNLTTEAVLIGLTKLEKKGTVTHSDKTVAE